jgi:hypothetical protein
MRYAEVSQKELKFLDVTSLTVEEFNQLVSVFGGKFQERMKELRLDGKPRIGRKHQTYANCPLPTPEDRLLFILVYLKTNNLQVIQGELFGMPQNKANQWIHTLLPVLQASLRSLGDAPARSMEELAQRLSQHILLDMPHLTHNTLSAVPNVLLPTSDVSSTTVEQEKHDPANSPLFAMMGRNGASSAPKIKMNRKAIIAARKNVTR